jgi:hypothetical protein
VPAMALWAGHVPLDAAASPRNNSGTHKQGVSCTYHGTDGYAPIAV